MPRPKRKRKMMNPPNTRGFRPFGISGPPEDPVRMLYEEYEAMRLADYEKFSQEQAATEMDVSRPTFTRIYDRALKKIASAMVEARSIIIEGGNVHFEDSWYRCNHCHTVFKTNFDRQERCAVCGAEDIQHINEAIDQHEAGTEDTRNSRADELCVCDSCGNSIRHRPGTPCREMDCPECGHKMRRE